MLIGYARISTEDQNINLQIDELNKIGCREIFTDISSGAKSERPGLDKALGFMREGDTLIVWKLDRLGRSIQHLIQMMHFLNERKISFRCIQENIDTTTSTGRLLFHIFSAIAEFELDLIKERTNAGLRAARARGRLGGRPFALDDRDVKRMMEMYDSQKMRVSEICKIYNVTPMSLYNYKKRFRKMELEKQ